MPYWLHKKDENFTNGKSFTDKHEAVKSIDAGLTVTFVASIEEKRTWQAREQKRLLDGVYKPLPWDFSLNATHFAHYSDDKKNVAFTPDDEHGVRDKQTVMAPGKYIKKFYSNHFFSDVQIARYVAIFEAAVGDLQIASTREEVTSVYQNGPESCMSVKLDVFLTYLKKNHKGTEDATTDVYPCHPSAIYGEPGDLRIAYTGTIDKPTARAIIWPEKKLHGTLYGHQELLRSMLTAAGYKQGNFYGARIPAIPMTIADYKEVYLSVAIDSHPNASLSECGNFLVLEPDRGEFSISYWSGFFGRKSRRCPTCQSEAYARKDEANDGGECAPCSAAKKTCKKCNKVVNTRRSYDYRYLYGATDEIYCGPCFRSSPTCKRGTNCGEFIGDEYVTPDVAAARRAIGREMFCGHCWQYFNWCEEHKRTYTADRHSHLARCSKCVPFKELSPDDKEKEYDRCYCTDCERKRAVAKKGGK